jgi:hypothetical protein
MNLELDDAVAVRNSTCWPSITVESIIGTLPRPEIELSALSQSGLAAKEFIEDGGTGVEFALDSLS